MIEIFTLPNGEKVTFEPETHSYAVNGTEVPSITSLIQRKYGDIYSSVNEELLKRAADYGTSVHKELETIITKRMSDPSAPSFSAFQEVQNYFQFIEPIYDVKPLSMEKVVVLHDERGVPVAAGRFDMICQAQGKTTIADFKTTSSLHKKQITAQLNLYLKGAVQSGYLEDSENVQLAAIQLSGFSARFVPISVLSDNFYLQFIQ